MTIFHSLELHHSAKHRQAKKCLWLSCLRIWFWWHLSNYHITHNWGENKIPLLETLTMGSFHPWLYWKGHWQICYTPGQGGDYPHPHSLIPLSRGRGGTHCRGRSWTGEKGRKVVWFEILLSWSLHPWRVGQGHLSLQAGTNVTCKVRFLSEAPWEEAHRAKFHFLNNSLLAIVKKHKAGEKGGIFIPNVRSTFARQGTVLHLTTHDPCSLFTLQNWQLQISTACWAAQWPPLAHTNSRGHTEDQGVHFRGGGQSKVCLGTGLQIQQMELQGSQVWTKTEQALKCAADKPQFTNAV